MLATVHDLLIVGGGINGAGIARDAAGRGLDFGGGQYQREANYFIAHEWAESAEDILWRRSKTGLSMTVTQQDGLRKWLQPS